MSSQPLPTKRQYLVVTAGALCIAWAVFGTVPRWVICRSPPYWETDKSCPAELTARKKVQCKRLKSAAAWVAVGVLLIWWQGGKAAGKSTKPVGKPSNPLKILGREA